MPVAPHTQGGTAATRTRDCRRGGCPAHAGRNPSGYLRTGGSSRVAPHTQGGTVPPGMTDQQRLGCPAHAGRNPCRFGRGFPFWGLPRTRRAEPITSSQSTNQIRVAPHTQGGTLADSEEGFLFGGCPAHAGRNQLRVRRARTRSGLPRTRRAEPVAVSDADGQQGVAPHTQGGTQPARHGAAAYRGCPAHAGRNRSKSATSGCSRRLPRTRRAEPRPAAYTARRMTVAPHTQGGTDGRCHCVLDGAGCPAHAGRNRRRG